jgi:branched-chain amino acid transport system substrate-binding protein
LVIEFLSLNYFLLVFSTGVKLMTEVDLQDGHAVPSRATRRTILKATGALGLTALTGAPLFAQDANHLRIGFISPRSGALASFGESDGYILKIAREAMKNGLTIGGRKYSVEILDRDTQSDPSRASQLAKNLISSEKVDLMLAISTPETINPVSDACEAAGVPCLSTVEPWEAWYYGRGAKPGQPSPFKWGYHFSFGVHEFLVSYLSLWSKIPNNKRVGALLPNDADGNAVRAALSPDLVKAGYTVIDAGPYETGSTDYSAQIARFKSEKVDIFYTFPLPPDFATFWRQAAQQGLTRQIKIAQIAKTCLFASTVEALGPIGHNLLTIAWWHKNYPYQSKLTGMNSKALADGYEAASGKQWSQQLGATLSMIDLGVEALRATKDPKDKAALAKALGSLNMETIQGRVDFTKGPVGNVATTALVGAQWTKNPPGSKFKFDLVVVENEADKNIPVAHAPNPYS